MNPLRPKILLSWMLIILGWYLILTQTSLALVGLIIFALATRWRFRLTGPSPKHRMKFKDWYFTLLVMSVVLGVYIIWHDVRVVRSILWILLVGVGYPYCIYRDLMRLKNPPANDHTMTATMA